MISDRLSGITVSISRSRMPLPPNPFTRDGKALVAIVHGQDPSAALRAGLEMLGGLDRLALRGKRALIKPHVVHDQPPPSTSSPPVTGAAGQKVREAGTGHVRVADECRLT